MAGKVLLPATLVEAGGSRPCVDRVTWVGPRGTTLRGYVPDSPDALSSDPRPLMRPKGPSRTAAGAAWRRASHQLIDRPPVFTDPLASVLLSREAKGRAATGQLSA